MCRWDLSPAILLLFHPAAIYFLQIGAANPPLWLLHEVNWHMVLAAPSLTDAGLGRPRGSRAPETLMGKKIKDKKEKELKCWCFMVRMQRSPSAGWGSAAQAALPGEESSPLSSLFHIFLAEPEEHLESPPSLACHTFKGYLLKEHLSGARIEPVLHGHGWWFRISVQRQGISEN